LAGTTEIAASFAVRVGSAMMQEVARALRGGQRTQMLAMNDHCGKDS
jgi:hypothetical protein